LAFKKLKLSLFSDISDEKSSTLLSLSIAVSSAVGVSPSAVSIRRILDVTFPLSPRVLWTNPNFAGDDFSRARRRLQGGSNSTGSVSVDMQIKLVDTAAASSLSTTLSSSVSKLADDVKQ